MRKSVFAALALFGAWPAAHAHSFGRLYNLPVPFWLYLYGAAATLIVSFALVGYFVSRRAPVAEGSSDSEPAWSWDDRGGWVIALRIAGLAALLFTILAGFAGTSNPYQNLGMTLFWVLFVLGLAYVTALVGDVYAAVSPWRLLVEGLERFAPRAFAGRVPNPERYGHWPALALYMGFIFIELFGRTRPYSLSLLLIGYTVLNLAGAAWLGKPAWFERGEFFAVFFRVIGKMAPRVRVRDAGGASRRAWRAPFVGLLREPVADWGLLLFILFMLASTAFDGLRETAAFVRVFWIDAMPQIVAMLGGGFAKNLPTLMTLYKAWQACVLLLSPLLYLGVFVLFLWLAQRLTRTTLTIRELALHFGYTLVPIAFVYNVTHYYTLLLTQGSQLPRLFADPLGLGWNLLGDGLGIGGIVRGGYIPDAENVWHTQVALILFGHVVSIWLAHVQALRLFATQRQAVASQLPMLALMVAFTVSGLWILSQPIQAQ